MEGLGRYFPENKSILEGSPSKFKHFDALVKSTMYQVGKECLGSALRTYVLKRRRPQQIWSLIQQN